MGPNDSPVNKWAYQGPIIAKMAIKMKMIFPKKKKEKKIASLSLKNAHIIILF